MYAPAVIHAANLSASVNTSLFPEQPQDMFRNAIFFLHVTGALPYGKRLMQAYAAGVPTVTVDTGVVGECITADHALICPMGDAACLAKQTLFMLDNPTVCESLRSHDNDILGLSSDTVLETIVALWMKSCNGYDKKREHVR
jgi:glycosyltransferase involved in cell wall biosynthesis